MPERITSAANARIKNLKKLDKSSERREQNLLLIEGLREIVLAHRAGYAINEVYICDDIFEDKEEYSIAPVLENVSEHRIFYLSKEAYQSLAYREGTEGIIATASPKQLRLEDLKLPTNPLILVIEAVEKPGNLGAMLRTADAAGVSAVIISSPATDVYNPNVIRGSIGTVFTVPIVVCDTPEAIKYLKEKSITTCAAELTASIPHYMHDFKPGSAVVVGTEANGLSKQWIDAADVRIKIPMLGQIDSLNVSVSAAVILYEAVRQRTLP
jgi:TrmH family RNA methyltransferase